MKISTSPESHKICFRNAYLLDLRKFLSKQPTGIVGELFAGQNSWSEAWRPSQEAHQRAQQGGARSLEADKRPSVPGNQAGRLKPVKNWNGSLTPFIDLCVERNGGISESLLLEANLSRVCL